MTTNVSEKYGGGKKKTVYWLKKWHVCGKKRVILFFIFFQKEEEREREMWRWEKKHFFKYLYIYNLEKN